MWLRKMSFDFHQNISIVEHCIVSKYFVLQSTAMYGVAYIEYRTGHSGPDSVVDTAIVYWLDGPGIESRWVEIFCICPDRPWGPHSLLHNGYCVFPGGKERPGRNADLSPPSSAVVKKE